MTARLRKYGSLFAISLTQLIYWRASFFMDRVRSFTILIAFYGFWSAVFSNHSTIAGYSRDVMLSYLIGTTLLRALVFSDKTWDMIREINTGRLSGFLLRPMSYIGYCIARDFADKSAHVVSAILEVVLLTWLLDIRWQTPATVGGWGAFALSVIFSVAIYFLLSYAVSALAFWTAESAGPRFCFELFLEFASGAFFPLDILPMALKNLFSALPFASLIYFPLQIFLGRADGQVLLQGFFVQIFWLIILLFTVRWVWQRGLKIYSSEGG